jgi:hypothetical protein
MTLEQFLAMAFAGPVAGFLARRGVREAARLEKQPAYRLPGLLRQLRRRRHKRRVRRTFWLLSWVAGLLGLSFVGILGLWTALGQ